MEKKFFLFVCLFVCLFFGVNCMALKASIYLEWKAQNAEQCHIPQSVSNNGNRAVIHFGETPSDEATYPHPKKENKSE